ncbi:uncharacterized protein UTRI_03560_B [Ustilago trichophora]|uniref:Mtf2-like C-terminal domain-containing protein n=1 Tax=Ustilago trichophora TaxID=86804 RepID=A0A5C3E2S3_9BASI|nr:uncharacterized protein UTRI_03560_B [Ustilago trichophora]
MASALSRSVRRWGAAASSCPSTVGTSYAIRRSLSATTRRFDEQKLPSSSASDQPSSSMSTINQDRHSVQDSSTNGSSATSSTSSYQPPSKSSGAWPFDSATTSNTDSASDASTSTSTANPYAGLFDGNDPFPKITVPDLSTASSSSESASEKGSWLSDKLDSLTTSPRVQRNMGRSSGHNPNQTTPDGRRKHPIPRSVLFADSETARQSDDFRPRKPSSNAARKKLDRTPLTQQEANAFMSLLNQALAGTSTPASGASEEEGDHTPFGSYTSLISNPKTQSGSKALLQAFAKRNKLKRFEEARAQRAKRLVREGLAAQIDPLQLEAGIDEAREQIATCENLAELMEWSKREVWGIGSSNASAGTGDLADMLSATTLTPSDPANEAGNKPGPKYGKDTPYYASVLQLLFLAIRDRYRAPHVALSIARITRSLGIESYVLGMTGSLYNEVLKTQWDWLGDLQGVVTTLRQARETGILSAPLKHSPNSPLPPTPPGTGIKQTFATSEDETIRETVDRIANEVRKYVLDQQMASDPDFKRKYLYGLGGSNARDVLGGGGGDVGQGWKLTVGKAKDWSHKWLLANAEEASSLAGQPFRLIQRQWRSSGDADRGGFRSGGARDGGRYAGGGGSADRRSTRPYQGDGGNQSRFGKGPSRYTPSYSARSSQDRSFNTM